MARKTRASQPAAYVLKVTLMETDPAIWRRLRVAGDTTLTRLDRIIQTAIGWTNSHLHTFTAGGVVYAQPDPEWDVRDERRVRLAQIVKQAGEAFVYEYDMGDSWEHQVLVEQVGVEWDGAEGPMCLAGERACPPEDSGGVPGYYEKLECLRNPRHPEYREIKNWIEGMTGGPFDPAVFDLDRVNAALGKRRSR